MKERRYIVWLDTLHYSLVNHVVQNTCVKQVSFPQPCSWSSVNIHNDSRESLFFCILMWCVLYKPVEKIRLKSGDDVHEVACITHVRGVFKSKNLSLEAHKATQHFMHYYITDVTGRPVGTILPPVHMPSATTKTQFYYSGQSYTACMVQI